MFGRFNFANTVLDGMSRSISVNPQRCSRIKHKSSPCTACHLNCPADAINVGAPGMTIRVDWQKCTGCGICVNVCPSQAYTLRHGGYKQIIDNCCRAVSADGVLIITCAQAEPAACSVAMECLGFLNAVDILALYLRGAKKIILRHGDCSGCASKWGNKILHKETETLKELAVIFEDIVGMTAETTTSGVVIDFPLQKPIVRPKEEEKPNPALDRRGLFSFFTQNIKETAIKSASMMTAEKPESRTLISFEQYLPQRRKLFLDSVMDLGRLMVQEVATGRLFNNISIDENCVFCGMCAKFCCTGALKMNEDKTEITFNPSKCTSCMLCEKACYHGKLHYKNSFALKDFFSDMLIIKKDSEGK